MGKIMLISGATIEETFNVFILSRKIKGLEVIDESKSNPTDFCDVFHTTENKYNNQLHQQL